MQFVEVMTPFAAVAEKKMIKVRDMFTNMKNRFVNLFNRFGGDFTSMREEKEIGNFWMNLWNFSLAIEKKTLPSTSRPSSPRRHRGV